MYQLAQFGAEMLLQIDLFSLSSETESYLCVPDLPTDHPSSCC